VDTNTVTKAIFGKNVIKREFTSVLIYRLQRKERLKFNEDNTSKNPQLLVVWRSDNRYEYSIGVLLTRHDNLITLNEDKLKKLDYPSLTLLRNDRVIRNTWILDDTTVLMTTSKWEQQIRTIKITISKGIKSNSSMMPLWVSPSM
jgi:hypothetical protein